jgi:hypothetical protein
MKLLGCLTVSFLVALAVVCSSADKPIPKDLYLRIRKSGE